MFDVVVSVLLEFRKSAFHPHLHCVLSATTRTLQNIRELKIHYIVLKWKFILQNIYKINCLMFTLLFMGQWGTVNVYDDTKKIIKILYTNVHNYE